MTNATDFAFSDLATKLQQTRSDGIKADNPPLTKREYFAAMAMQGIISDQTYLRPNNGSEIAERAVEMADALITELNK